MQKTGKLELTWVGKYDEKVIEPRILVEDLDKSYGDPTRENMLIHGDNLIALQALQQDFAGKIKCIYIDPPYTFWHMQKNILCYPSLMLLILIQRYQNWCNSILTKVRVGNIQQFFLIQEKKNIMDQLLMEMEMESKCI